VTVLAGTLTTASALSYTFFSLLSQPYLLRRLRTELQIAMPNPKQAPPLATLEQLPFLTACIKEGLRLSNGVSTRLQRIDPDNSIVFTDKTRHKGKTYILPAGTPLSMTGMLTHLDENVFPDPLAFRPHRWLDGSAQDKYLVPFSRGTRQCIGINLAYAENYLTLAMLFRVYGSPEVRMKGDLGYLELFETEWGKDVEIVGDGVTPLNREGSKGIRVKVMR
jgi:cytochrome P450